jgi:hypothetical protein
VTGCAAARWYAAASGPLAVEREGVADAVGMIGWHPLPVPDSVGERLYADRAGPQTAEFTWPAMTWLRVTSSTSALG